MDESPEGSTMPFREAALLNAFLPMPTTRYIVLLCFTLAGTDISPVYREGWGGRDVPLVGNFHMLFLCIYNVEEEFLSIFSGDGEIVCVEQGGASQ